MGLLCTAHEGRPLNQGTGDMSQPNILPIASANGAELTESGNVATAAFQQLTKAYQELATRNVANLTAAMLTLSSVKSPTEFIAAQQKLIKDGVTSAISDSQNIAQSDNVCRRR
jgi:hypothetical protein